MNFDEYYWLPRAGIFSSAYDEFERLPILWGYLPGSSRRIKEYVQMPIINDNNTTGADQRISWFLSFGHCHKTTLADDAHFAINGINVPYLTSGVHEGTVFEGQNITYFDLWSSWSPRDGEFVVFTNGNGRSSSTGTTVAMNNIIDILEDFLCNISTYPSSIFDSQSKTKANKIFNDSSYKAAFALTEDDIHWNIIQKMIGSFGGNAYINAQGKLCFNMLTTYVNPYSITAIIPKAETELISAKQKAANLINRCPVSFDYSPYKQEFFQHQDPASNVNMISQNIFGKQEPSTPMKLYAVYDTTTADKIQKTIVEKYAFPKWEITFEDKTLKRAHLDVGDIIVTSLDELYQKDGNPFTNRALEIIGINPDYSRGTVQFRAWDMGLNMDSSHMLSSVSYDETEY